MRTSTLVALASSAVLVLVAIGGATAGTREDQQPARTGTFAVTKNVLARTAGDRRSRSATVGRRSRVASRRVETAPVGGTPASEPADEPEADDDQGNDDQAEAQEQGGNENEQAEADDEDDDAQADVDDGDEPEVGDVEDGEDAGEPDDD